MASGPITSWEIDGETVETVSDFIFLGSKITADGDCSHEIKRCLLLGRKVMTNLDSILKSRDSASFGSTYTKIGMIQRLAWPLHKDDMKIREVFHIFADEWIRKLWYIYTMEYYSAIKNISFESVLMRWRKLEPIIQMKSARKIKTITVY